LLLETVAYAETSVCRRKMLLHYFGEKYDEPNCHNCDNCLHPKKEIEASEELKILLETVLTIKERHNAEHTVNVITGQAENEVKKYGHDKIDVFGDGAEQDTKFWMALVRHALLAQLLAKDIDHYGLLKVTPQGKEFLKKPHNFKITQDHDYENAEVDEDEESGAVGGASAADPNLFSMLKDLRKKLAKSKNLPPFVIFQDPSLEEMAIQYPVSISELKNITGVGTGKAAKYGKPFVDLIAKYVEENEIERPMDLVVKSVVNKSGLKVYIIQNIDRKLSLDDLAEAKGISLGDVIAEIERIVASGTRIDINYYLNEVIDPERQNEVFEYFRSAETDSIKDALSELGEEEYSEDEIRLMRVKFMSELGN
jgi:ATP-dependent DNA helicase RecQ